MNLRRILAPAVLAAVLAGPLAAAAQDRAGPKPDAATAPAAAPAATPSATTTPSGSADAAAPRTNDFPTQSRVEYVLDCLRDNADRPEQEMLYKCVCAVDAVASRVSHERWIELSVFNNARPIAGERGAYIRERRDAPSMARAYRELQAGAYKSCFINKVN